MTKKNAEPSRLISLHKIATKCKDKDFEGIDAEDFLAGEGKLDVRKLLQQSLTSFRDDYATKHFFSFLLKWIIHKVCGARRKEIRACGEALNADMMACKSSGRQYTDDIRRRLQEHTSAPAKFEAEWEQLAAPLVKIQEADNLEPLLDLLFKDLLSERRGAEVPVLNATTLQRFIVTFTPEEACLVASFLGSGSSVIRGIFQECADSLSATIEELVEAFDDLIVQKIFVFLIEHMQS